MEAASAQGGPWTVGRLLAWTRDFLHRRAIDSPRLSAELLLAHALGCERIRLYTQFDQVPASGVLDRLRAAVREAADGRPIAHLTGTKEFFSLTFEVTPDVLIPRPETEVLVERAIDLVRRAGGGVRRVLDLGTGSGCIAVSLARHLPDVRVFASDVSEAALAVARRNAARHAVAGRIEFAAGDLFDPWRSGATTGAACQAFDVIVCNPPYIATRSGTCVQDAVRRYEPGLALFGGEDGLDLIRRIAAGAPAHLDAGGHLLIEMAYDQAGRVRDFFAGANWCDVVTYRDAAGHERVAHARRRTADQMQVA